MTVAIDQVVVFDTDLDARELRLHRAQLAIDAGAVPGAPTLKATGDRLDCLDMLRGMDSVEREESPLSLLLCDMVDDDRQGEVGNIGARLLRTVATDRDLRDRVARILWTQYDHPTVITDSSYYAHAFIWFDHADRTADQLITAITAVFADDWPTEFRHFAPRGLTAEQFDDIWRNELRLLLKPGRRLKINDDIAAASILRGGVEADRNTDAVLRQARIAAPPAQRRDFCESIDEFLERLKGSKREARDAVADTLGRMSQVGIATPISPILVEHARALMAEHPVHRELRYLTGLTAAEDDLARTAVALYEHHLKALKPDNTRNNQMYPKAALDAMSNDPRLERAFADPELADCTQNDARRTETLSYVIGTYNDTRRSIQAREAAAGRPAVA